MTQARQVVRQLVEGRLVCQPFEDEVPPRVPFCVRFQVSTPA